MEGKESRERRAAAIRTEKAPEKTSGATILGSTSARMMAGSLPPSSRVTRFMSFAQAAMMDLPVATDPVPTRGQPARCCRRRGGVVCGGSGWLSFKKLVFFLHKRISTRSSVLKD